MLLLGNMEVDYKYFSKESNEYPASESATHYYHGVCLHNEHVNNHYLFNTI